MFDAFGLGWTSDLAKAILWLALLGGGIWLRYHLATIALTDVFQRVASAPAPQAAPQP